MNKLYYLLFIFLGLLAPVFFACLPVGRVFAATGTIDSTYKYAWSTNGGWINFKCSGCNVQITDNAITGYIWDKNYGWINLNPISSGVKNNGQGVLSGKAWGENVGWVDFANVSINSQGQFVGTASGIIIGTVAFENCGASCGVKTDWRPTSTPPPTPICGNGACEAGENCENCSNDCGGCGGGTNYCGDGDCHWPPENCVTCLADCGPCFPVCGDGICNGSENCINCSTDCSCGGGSITCAEDSQCGANEYTGPLFCQDNSIYQNYTTHICNNPGLTNSTCSSSTLAKLKSTCSPIQICKEGSCIDPVCGDDFCDENETCANCPKDCECVFPPPPLPPPPPPTPTPLPPTPTPLPPPPQGLCGNGVCDVSENCGLCERDCGKCAPAVEIKEIINIPVVPVILKTISTLGLALGIIVFAPTSIPEIFLLPFRLWSLLLTAFGLKKRVVPWGVVYDSVTKQPLDPAYVVLKNMQGQEIATAITDMDGRYGFLVEPGVYNISARKTNYIFPSQKLAGRNHDELYSDIYFGENIEIKESGEVIVKNIPLDPLKFDWNEFAKRGKKLMKFYSKWDIILRKIYDSLFAIGFIMAVAAYNFAPYPYNTIIMLLYLFLLLLRLFGLRPKSYGSVVDKITGNPMSFAILRIVVPGFGEYPDREISSKPADQYGKYYCLVPTGKYYVKIDKKNDDGSYSSAYTSSIIDTSKDGIIKKIFKI